MNVGATGMDAATQFGVAAFDSATKTQASAAMKIINSGTQQGSGSELSSAAMAEQGKGMKLDVVG